MRLSYPATSTVRSTILAFAVSALAPFALADEAEPQKKVPNWEALTGKANELLAERYSPEDLALQIEKKQTNLESLYQKQGALEVQLAGVLGVTKRALEEIEAIDDPVLRDESLLRFRSTKQIHQKTVGAALDATNMEIARETKELQTLQRILQARRAEALLHGKPDPAGSSYQDFLAREASRVRDTEHAKIDQAREEQVTRLENVLFPDLKPKVASLTEAVLTENAEP